MRSLAEVADKPEILSSVFFCCCARSALVKNVVSILLPRFLSLTSSRRPPTQVKSAFRPMNRVPPPRRPPLDALLMHPSRDLAFFFRIYERCATFDMASPRSKFQNAAESVGLIHSRRLRRTSSSSLGAVPVSRRNVQSLLRMIKTPAPVSCQLARVGTLRT